MPSRPDNFQDRRQPFRKLIRVGSHRPPERHSAFVSALEGGCAIWVAQLHTARLGHGQGLFGAPGDRLAFCLRHQSHDPHRQVICLGHVDCEEMHPTVAQGEQERGVAAEPVQLGDDEGRPR